MPVGLGKDGAAAQVDGRLPLALQHGVVVRASEGNESWQAPVLWRDVARAAPLVHASDLLLLEFAVEAWRLMLAHRRGLPQDTASNPALVRRAWEAEATTDNRTGDATAALCARLFVQVVQLEPAKRVPKALHLSHFALGEQPSRLAVLVLLELLLAPIPELRRHRR